jgi:hypothetical protein
VTSVFVCKSCSVDMKKISDLHSWCSFTFCCVLGIFWSQIWACFLIIEFCPTVWIFATVGFVVEFLRSFCCSSLPGIQFFWVQLPSPVLHCLVSGAGPGLDPQCDFRLHELRCWFCFMLPVVFFFLPLDWFSLVSPHAQVLSFLLTG